MNDMDDKLIQAFADAFFAHWKHGDEAHQKWLREETDKFFAEKAPAFRSAILADAAKDVGPVAWGLLGENGKARGVATRPNEGWEPLCLASTLAAAQALNAELVARVEGLEKDAALQWPKQRRVGRREDMSPDGFMVVGLDSDNDVYIAVTPSEQGYRTGIEFCNGGGGGGSSMRTREALINLMTAIEADNASRPDKAFPPVDAAIAARSGT